MPSLPKRQRLLFKAQVNDRLVASSALVIQTSQKPEEERETWLLLFRPIFFPNGSKRKTHFQAE